MTYVTDATGQILSRRETDNTSGGDPKQVWWFFDGKQVGTTSNNGNPDPDYDQAVDNWYSYGSGPFRQGRTSGPKFSDFDMNFNSISPGEGGTGGGAGASYTVRSGDTLDKLARQFWGDASLWYMIADANGLSGASQLIAGQTIRIPAKIANIHNTSDTFRPYDATRSVGDVMPNTPTPPPPPKKKGCGILGAILLVIVAIVVTVVTAGAALSATGAVQGGLMSGINAVLGIGSVTVAGGGLAGALALTGALAVGGAVGSVVTQGISILAGTQDKFSWKAVGLGAIGGAVGGAIGPGGFFGAKGLFAAAGPLLGNVARGMVSNVVTQGVGVATGLQDKFNWSGVAAGAAGGLVGGWAGGQLGGKLGSALVERVVAGMAGGIAGAAAQSLIDGTDFGDTLVAVLPGAIASAVAGYVLEDIATGKGSVAGGVRAGGGTGDGSGDEIVVTARPRFSLEQAYANAAAEIEAESQRRQANTQVEQGRSAYNGGANNTSIDDRNDIVVTARIKGKASLPAAVVIESEKAIAQGNPAARPAATFGPPGLAQLEFSSQANGHTLTSWLNERKILIGTKISAEDMANTLHAMLASPEERGYGVQPNVERLIAEIGGDYETAKHLVTDLFDYDSVARATISGYDGRIGALAYGTAMGTFASNYSGLNFDVSQIRTPEQYIAETVMGIRQERARSDYFSSLPDPNVQHFRSQAEYQAFRNAQGVAAGQAAANIPIQFITFTASAAAGSVFVPLVAGGGATFLAPTATRFGISALTTKMVVGGMANYAYAEGSSRIYNGEWASPGDKIGAITTGAIFAPGVLPNRLLQPWVSGAISGVSGEGISQFVDLQVSNKPWNPYKLVYSGVAGAALGHVSGTVSPYYTYRPSPGNGQTAWAGVKHGWRVQVDASPGTAVGMTGQFYADGGKKLLFSN